MSFHNDLRDILIEFGEKALDKNNKTYFSRSYSGDSEPLDLRRGRKSTEWNPDIIWIRKGKTFITEIALSENWRSIVGEFTLAKILDAWGILFISDFDYEYLTDLLSILGKSLNYNKWYFYHVEDPRNPEKLAKKVVDWLIKEKFTGWK